MLLIGLALLSTTTAKAEEPVFIDDAALKKVFEKKLGALLDKGKVPAASDLIAQLGKMPKEPIDIGPHEEKSPLEVQGTLYQKVLPSTLLLGRLYKCDRCSHWHGAFAGAVIVGHGGIAVTNYHVINTDNAAAFGAMDYQEKLYPVLEVLASSKDDDLAIIRLEDCDLEPVPLAESALPGDPVHILSHPDGHFFTYTRGVVSRNYLLGKSKAPRMQVSADFARGSSGSGVFSDEGKLTGIVASTNSIYYRQKKGEDENLQMVIKTCIPVSQLHSLLIPQAESAER